MYNFDLFELYLFTPAFFLNLRDIVINPTAKRMATNAGTMYM